MNKIVELVISQGHAWLLGIAAILAAFAQIIKARKVPRKAPTIAKPSATRSSAPEAAPAATSAKSWRHALWEETKYDVFSAGFAALGLLDMTFLVKTVSAPMIVGTAVFAGQFFFSLLMMQLRAKWLRERWRD